MPTVTLFQNKKDCCGCGACMNICPQKAIKMQEDEYGFDYPVIDHDKCVNCGMCTRTCGYQNRKFFGEPINTFVSQASTSDIKKSASGGVFANIARNILLAGGIVYGVSMEYIDRNLIPMHICVEKVDDLIKLQGSKYVQSSIGTVYYDIKVQLNKGRLVLFSGVPCQVDALRHFLRKHYDTLYCVDIICHGVPSAKLFQDYIKTLEKKYNDKVIDFKFRDKILGWGLTANAYTANAGNKVIPCYASSYYDMFLKSFTYRENCYSCKYANKHRVGDITIGDYWGIEKEHPEFLAANGGPINEQLGVSCIIINNERGKLLVDNFGSGLLLEQSRYDKVAKHNRQLNSPSSLDKVKRERILNAYKLNGYPGVEKEYRNIIGMKQLCKNKLKEHLPSFVIDCIRKIRK